MKRIPAHDSEMKGLKMEWSGFLFYFLFLFLKSSQSRRLYQCEIINTSIYQSTMNTDKACIGCLWHLPYLTTTTKPLAEERCNREFLNEKTLRR